MDAIQFDFEHEGKVSDIRAALDQQIKETADEGAQNIAKEARYHIARNVLDKCDAVWPHHSTPNGGRKRDENAQPSARVKISVLIEADTDCDISNKALGLEG